MLRPHVVFRTRPSTSLIDYWTGEGWSPDISKAKQIEWWAGLGLITHHRSDPETQDWGFGMTPAGAL